LEKPLCGRGSSPVALQSKNEWVILNVISCQLEQWTSEPRARIRIPRNWVCNENITNSRILFWPKTVGTIPEGMGFTIRIWSSVGLLGPGASDSLKWNGQSIGSSRHRDLSLPCRRWRQPLFITLWPPYFRTPLLGLVIYHLYTCSLSLQLNK
jgi:hypothetical protein